MNLIPYRRRVALADREAVEIGTLYRKGVRSFLEVGQKLSEKKQSLAHGEWLLWFDTNSGALQFGLRTAQKLMKIAAKYAVNGALEATEANAISRELWGNTDRTARITAITENAREPTPFDQQLERLRRAWAAAETAARQEFLALISDGVL
jgi:hypothetical protein